MTDAATPSTSHTGLIVGVVVVALVLYLLFHSSGSGSGGGATAQEFGPTSSDASIAASQDAANAGLVSTVAQFFLGEEQTAAGLAATNAQTAAGVTTAGYGLQLGEQGNTVAEQIAAEEAAVQEYVSNQQRSGEVAVAKAGGSDAQNISIGQDLSSILGGGSSFLSALL